MRLGRPHRRLSLQIGVNPALSKVDNKPFRFLGGFESIRQRVNRVRVALAIGLPSDFRARAPKFAALLKGGVGDDQPIVVEQICHAGELAIPRTSPTHALCRNLNRLHAELGWIARLR